MQYDSIGLAGTGVGVLNLATDKVKWAPRNEGDAEPKDVSLDSVLRSSWAPIGKMCHLRLFCKDGSKIRFDGFRKSDIDGLKKYFEANDIELEKESIASGGGNYGTLDFESKKTPHSAAPNCRTEFE